MRKFLLFYVALMLSAAPMAVQAADKKPQKHLTATKKHDLVHYKSANVKIRNRLHIQESAAVYAESNKGPSSLQLGSAKVLVINQLTGETMYAKNTSTLTPIASVTKLMTAMVMLDAQLSMDDLLIITDADIDNLKNTHSRLSVGTSLSRGELLQLALMASENRAASALGRNYPGGINAFIRAMNQKALSLDMQSTHFSDSTGLDSTNVSTAEDLVRMVNAAYHYPEIREVTTTVSRSISPYGRGNPLKFVNTNVLVRGSDWVIGLSKTGFINEAGRCLVMQAEIAGQPMIIVLMDSVGKLTRIGDANRIRKWIEHNEANSLGKNVSG
jgi:D-alanyl-D-alanine endopeptidase (penicillin-binding protein 7)